MSSKAASRMGTTSPADSKKNLSKVEDNLKKESQQSINPKPAPPRSEPTSSAKQPPDPDTSKTAATTDPSSTSNAEAAQPLAPPPRPNQQQQQQQSSQQQNPSDTPDYFSAAHNGSHFSLEPNPFEQSFGNPATETPGKSLLPPVASLTSPASLLQGGSASGGFNWPNSLRSGPLSPAMLTGPTGSSNDYFDPHLRASFPTPNESSLRTGLTPGGGGSMFPAPSPNSQAIYNQLASGGATPSTIDFHRTAMNFANQRKNENGPTNPQDAANNPAEQGVANQTNPRIKQEQNMAPRTQAQQKQQMQANASADPFGQHDANDAANGLFLLAQARNGAQGAQNPFGAGNQNPAANQVMGNAAQATMANQMANMQSQNASPNMAKRAANEARNSIGGSLSGSARGVSEMSGDFSDSGADLPKSNTRSKGKKGSSAKGAANGRRKAEDTPSKQPPNKKAKANNASAMPDFTIDSDEGEDKNNDMHESGRKMTDEEKRKNFLERNRVAALKCRQRKKQWLANLQSKVELFSTENDALSASVTQLREEVVNLKTLLLAHKDCPVSQQQGISSMGMNSMPVDYNHHANPYGMAMANNGQVMQQGMQRS
ncbi:MAG: hypothetical protein M4579_002156 [Chaenotheca gracillima]|nr:MAG: hypothetical protein M4579_002156 [Chaenotheca gracillima]